jgi:uncharacterized protein
MIVRRIPGFSTWCLLSMITLALIVPAVAAGAATLEEQPVGAAKSGNVALTKELLDKGADLNARDSSGKTALKKAEEKKRTEVAQYLKSIGAN